LPLAAWISTRETDADGDRPLSLTLANAASPSPPPSPVSGSADSVVMKGVEADHDEGALTWPGLDQAVRGEPLTVMASRMVLRDAP
jgi:hypothetical protein